MKDLDKTKVYYLGDLSDEQYFEIIKRVGLNPRKEKGNALDYFNYKWNVLEYIRNLPHFINALTLFEQDNNQRIIEIQLRIQELNNEIIILNNELIKLKK